MGPSAAELSIKHIGIVLTAYIILLNALGRQRTAGISTRRKNGAAAAVVLIGTVTGCLYNVIPIGCLLSMLLLFFLIMGALLNVNRSNMVTLTIVSFGVSYLLSLTATMIFIFTIFLNKAAVSDRFERSVDAWIYVLHYITNFWGGIFSRTFIFVVQLSFLALLLRFKKVRAGLRGLLRVEKNELVVFLCVVVLSLRVLVLSSVFNRNDLGAVMLIGLFIMILLSFIFYFWLKKEYRLSYSIQLQENELQLLENSLDSKQAYFKELQAVNERFGALIHRDNKLIPSVVMSVRQSAQGSPDSVSSAVAREAAGSLDEISEERNAVLSEYEASGRQFPATGVTETDAVLLYLCDKASAMGIELNVEITASPESIPASTPERCEFIAVLADLWDYSCSTASGENGAAAVKIGQDDGRLFIEISDNGTPFDRKALKKSGRNLQASVERGEGENCRPVSLFRILRHSGAVLSVNEFPEKEKYTKSLRVTFPNEKEKA